MKSTIQIAHTFPNTLMLLETVSPAQYQEMGHTLVVYYRVVVTPLGPALIASLHNRLCGFYFLIGIDVSEILQELQADWPRSRLCEAESAADWWLEGEPPFANVSATQPGRIEVPLVMKGTPFQLKVWQTLLAVPLGRLISYEALAGQAGYPTAVRAAASAVADNPIAWLVPCHRVVYKSGKIGNYRWGAAIKTLLIQQEAALLGEKS
jgi:AraC family transcriptional regulator, regulatory protein of adaptative response / methylated-DNA-[protein]-cysteine methyltransferase